MDSRIAKFPTLDILLCPRLPQQVTAVDVECVSIHRTNSLVVEGVLAGIPLDTEARDPARTHFTSLLSGVPLLPTTAKFCPVAELLMAPVV